MENDKPEQNDEDRDFVHPDPVMDAALNWLFTLQASPDDAALRAEFDEWRNADVSHAARFDEVSGAWDLPEMDAVAKDIASHEELPTVERDPVVRPFARPRRVSWTGALAAAAAVVLLMIGIQQYPVLMLKWQADYMTAAGGRDDVTLPDGSRMVLNTSSAVSIDFQGGRRSVALLQGEAFFDVVRDPSRPFTVAAAFSEVEVKGTAFTVETDDRQDTVVLERGHVDVTRLSQPADEASLEPGESIVATATALSPVRKVDVANSLAWLDGRIVFSDRPIRQVFSDVGRYYGHSIIIADSRLDNVRINGSYRLDDPERIIRSLATAAGASVTRIPGGVLILH